VNCCPVDIWTFNLNAGRTLVLTEEELARANRFVFEKDQRHWGQARTAMRTTLAGYLHCAPLDVSFVYGPNGKPAISPDQGVLEFNISHSRGWAMLAVVTSGFPVGIDLETIRANVDIAKLLRRLGEAEPTGTTEELFHLWTRREARTKALGGQLMLAPEGDLRVADVTAPAGFAASVALLGATPEPRHRQL